MESSGEGGIGSEEMDKRQLPSVVLGQPFCISLWTRSSTMVTSLQGKEAPCARIPA